ncbi:MAG: hypothetical protein ABIR94_17495 [Rubrivivax sp.]
MNATTSTPAAKAAPRRAAVGQVHGALWRLAATLWLACATSVALAAQGDTARDNQMLNEGYSLLYQAVSGLRFSDDLLLVKRESDRVEKVIGGVAALSDKLKADLERIAKNYPAVRIDLEPLPEMEQRKRSAVTKDRLKSYAQLVGLKGEAFERTLLLSTSGALNQTRTLCQVLAELEPQPELKRFLLDAAKSFDDRYEDVVVLLNQVYFKDNTYRRK